MRQDWDPKFPEGPPANCDPNWPFANKEAMLEMRKHTVRRKAVDMEKAKILKERLRECYLWEGVKHLQNCKKLAEMYIKSIKVFIYLLSIPLSSESLVIYSDVTCLCGTIASPLSSSPSQLSRTQPSHGTGCL